jgi:hypothetical protein
MRLPSHLIAPLAACVLGAACNSSSTSPNSGLAHLRVVNAATSGGSITVFIDGGQVALPIAPATSSATLSVVTGTRTVEFRTTGGFGLTRSVVFTDNADVVAVGIDSAGGVAPEVLSDTNSIVPAGASKLRVAHMAQNAGPIDIWRTQPDWSTPIRVEFPFPYRAESPYLQSTPGNWRILVSDTVPVATPNAPMPDTLADSGPIAVTDGTSATVVVVDKPGGGLAFVVVRP